MCVIAKAGPSRRELSFYKTWRSHLTRTARLAERRTGGSEANARIGIAKARSAQRVELGVCP